MKFYKQTDLPNLMALLTIKGYTFAGPQIKNSHGRRAILFQNKIFANLKKLDVGEDYINIELEPVSLKRVPASVSWYMDGHNLHYSCKTQRNFVENLFVVCKIIELEVAEVMSGQKSINEFISEFSEDEDVEEKRKEARTLLGVSEDELDLDLITKNFKDLAKKTHPDMDGGDIDMFKKLNAAHKLLRKELR